MSSTPGWALSGESLIMEKPQKGCRVNLLDAVTLDGPLALVMTEQTAKGETFAGFQLIKSPLEALSIRSIVKLKESAQAL